MKNIFHILSASTFSMSKRLQGCESESGLFGRTSKKRKMNVKFEPLKLYDLLENPAVEVAVWVTSDRFALDYKTKEGGKSKLTVLIGGAKNLGYYGFVKQDEEWFHNLIENDSGSRLFRQGNRERIKSIQRATIAHHVPNGCTLVPVYTINHIGLNLMRDNPPILSITCDDRSVDEMSSLIKTQQAEIRRLRTELKSKNDEIGLWTQQCYSLLGCKNDLEAELLQIKGKCQPAGCSSTENDPSPAVDTSYECPICYVTRDLNDLWGFECGHHCCKQCLRVYIRKQIASRSVPILCPFPCTTEIRPGEISCLVEKDIYKQFVTAMQDALVMKDESLKYCLTPGCETIIKQLGIDSRYNCMKCLNSYCISCEVPYHEGFSCAEYKQFSSMIIEPEDDAILSLKEMQSNFVKCDCGTWIEAMSLCSVLQCRCGNLICGKCNRNLRPGEGCHHPS